jgi:hypothetical protein
MHQPTQQEIEARKAIERINYYLEGGSRLVYISRGILAGLIVLILVLLLSRGLWN